MRFNSLLQSETSKELQTGKGLDTELFCTLWSLFVRSNIIYIFIIIFLFFIFKCLARGLGKTLAGNSFVINRILFSVQDTQVSF